MIIDQLNSVHSRFGAFLCTLLAVFMALPATALEPVFRVRLDGEIKVAHTVPINQAPCWQLVAEGFNVPGDPSAKAFAIDNNFPPSQDKWKSTVPAYGKFRFNYPLGVARSTTPAAAFKVKSLGHKACSSVEWRPQTKQLSMKWKIVDDTSKFVNGDGSKGKCIELTSEKDAVLLVACGEGKRWAAGGYEMADIGGWGNTRRYSDPVYMEPMDEGKIEYYYAMAVHFNWCASKVLAIQTVGKGVTKNPEVYIDGKKVL